MLTTSRGFRYPQNSDTPDIERDMGNLAADINGQYIETTAALRPAASKVGRKHRATDTGQVSLDIGSAWVDLANPDNVTLDRSAGVLRLMDGAVTAAKVNGALKPSVSAAAGTESLRALGLTASTAAAGNDSRFPAGADIVTADIADNAITQVKMADNSVGTAELRDAEVTNAKIQSLVSVDLSASASHAMSIPSGTWKLVVISWDLEITVYAELRLNPNALVTAIYRNVRDGTYHLSTPSTVGLTGGNTTLDNNGLRLSYPPASGSAGAMVTVGSATFALRVPAPTSANRLHRSQAAVHSIGGSGNHLIEVSNIAGMMASVAALTSLTFATSAGTMTGRITAEFR